METWISKFIDFLENDKHLSLNTLQSYKRDIEQYISYLREIKISDLKNGQNNGYYIPAAS